MSYITLYGFNNTYGIAIKKELSDKYYIKNYSDLARIAHQLKFGAEYDFFERKDGYEAFQERYHLDFKETVDIEVSLKYKALLEDKVDVIVVFTTDAMLSNNNIILLKDDKHFFPTYNAGNVVREETLEKFPELTNILEKLNGSINSQEMANMNYRVEVDKISAKDVAIDFLIKKGLIKP